VIFRLIDSGQRQPYERPRYLAIGPALDINGDMTQGAQPDSYYSPAPPTRMPPLCPDPR